MIYSVEDDAAIRELILYALRQAGFEAEGFEEGTAFRQAVAKAKPELVCRCFAFCAKMLGRGMFR